MSIEQIVEIPASRRLTIEVPREVPAGRTILTFTPADERARQGVEREMRPAVAHVIPPISPSARRLQPEQCAADERARQGVEREMRPAVAHVIPPISPPARRLQPEQRAAGSGEAVKDSKYWYTAPLAELDAEIERRLQHPLTNEDELKMFRGILRTQGAWKDNPWENCIEDIRAMREEWAHRDPWNPDLEKRHRD